MIKITKDTDTKIVTKGAYNTFYKSLGYKEVSDKKPETKVENKGNEKTIPVSKESKDSNKK